MNEWQKYGEYMSRNRKKKKKVFYEMLDGIPIKEHLRKRGKEVTMKIKNSKYECSLHNIVTEKLGRMYISKHIRSIARSTYPDVKILHVKILDMGRSYGDRLYEVDYKKGDKYGKKVLLFEIKCGNTHMSQTQLRKYCNMILNPSKYIKKADELHVYYLIFPVDMEVFNPEKITFCLSELTASFAKRILDTEPKRETQKRIVYPEPPIKRIDIDKYFMKIAEIVSERSTCVKQKVGAVLVKDKHIISTGYNGAPKGVKHCTRETCLRINLAHGEKPYLCRGAHAEANAIAQAAYHGVDTNGSDIYCTHFPCMSCCKLLINAGIRKIYYRIEYEMDNKLKMNLLKEAGINIEAI